MVEFIFHPANRPFTVALMFCITVIEGAGAFMGLGFSEYLDNLFPGLDTSVDLEAPDVDTGSAFSRFWGWLRIKKVPLLVLIVFFLTSFGLLGLALQAVAERAFGAYLPSVLASAGALAATLPVVRFCGRACARFLPGDETEAISEKSYIGKVAHITLGRATVSSPAQARLTDRFGTTHYIMVEPDVDGEVFAKGEAVLVVGRKGAVFSAIRPESDELRDDI